jgi:hypothetical protein
MRHSLTSIFAVVLVVSAGAGCSRRATVKGKVTYRDRPVTYGSVIFLSADKTARSAVIEPDGTYTVEKVRPGTVKIGVISRDPSMGEHGKKPDHAQAAKDWFPLPKNLEDPEKSGYECSIGSGNVKHDIELK